MKTVVRKLEVFSVHAHAGAPAIDYTALMTSFERLSPEARVYREQNTALAVGPIRRTADRFRFEVYEGPLGVSPFIYDLERAQARTELLERAEIMADITHVMLDANERRAVIEYVRRGAKANSIGRAISSILATNLPQYKDLQVDFAPVIDNRFLELIASFDRIREADLTLTRPNSSWTDHYTAMSGILEDSDGDNADLSVRAGRGKSLQKRRGIIGLIEEALRDEHPYLKKAAIRGTRRGEEGETTLSTVQHVTHSVARVSQEDDGQIRATQLYEGMTALLDSTAGGDPHASGLET